MLIKQLSIFLENKKGRFTEVTTILGNAGINMTAFTVAENSDFGIVRLLVSDPEKARSIFLTSSLRHPKIFIEQFSDQFMFRCQQHGFEHCLSGMW